MRILLFAVCSVVAALGVYFIVLKPSAEERLSRNLLEVTGSDGLVSLDACDLSLVVELAGQKGSPIALTRIAIQADLHNYDFKTVHFTPGSDIYGLRIGRGPVDDRMLAQVEELLDAGDGRMGKLFPNDQTAREILEVDRGALSFRVMAEIVTAEDGSQNFIAHEDAPDFFQLAEAVEAVATPTSYRSTTTFAPGGKSAETLLTGEVVVVPFLQFSLKSEDEAKELAHAFHAYAAENECK